jgi:hypothetical protein
MRSGQDIDFQRSVCYLHSLSQTPLVIVTIRTLRMMVSTGDIYVWL